MLVIHPDECIDCGVCVPECPAEAIVDEAQPEATNFWLELNEKYADLWPNITARKSPLSDAETQNGKSGKLNAFSPEPGDGDDTVIEPEPSCT